MFIFNFKYNLVTCFCILLMINGCQNNKKKLISGSYVEFAERRVLPEFKTLKKELIKPKHRRDGFETSNADRIFESTFTKQVDHS